MGRYSFPIPGRKSKSKKEDPAASRTSIPSTSTHSKAQKILGTEGGINIDLPKRSVDQHAWEEPGNRSSGMSITISESSIYSDTANSDWARESVVPPAHQRLPSKRNSTLLGHRSDKIPVEVSPTRPVLHSNASSTTMPPMAGIYDRQNNLSAVSQLTTASAARPLSLQNGQAGYVMRPPLQELESTPYPVLESLENKQDPRKNGNFELSRVFSRSKRTSMRSVDFELPGDIPRLIGKDKGAVQRKLTKGRDKETIQAEPPIPMQMAPSRPARPPRPPRPVEEPPDDVPPHLRERYEPLPSRKRMSDIPEARVPTPVERKSSRPDNVFELPAEKFPSPVVEMPTFTWRKSKQWDASSTTSVASYNTKTSRRTSTSAFSNSDLKQNSVLSLSSDSEESDVESSAFSHSQQSGNSPSERSFQSTNVKSERAPQRQRTVQSERNGALQHRPPQQLPKPPPDKPLPDPRASNPASQHSTKGSSSKSSKSKRTQPSGKLEVPNASTRPHLTDPWAAPQKTVERKPVPEKEKRSPRGSRSSVQSISSVSSKFDDSRESRFMAVTKQEQQLLAALRQKRANMQEDRDNSNASPLKSGRDGSIASSSTDRRSETSSVNTIRSPGHDPREQSILLYLDPKLVADGQNPPAEPSPDLSDFLTFGSDTESTPRTSWAAGAAVPARKSSKSTSASQAPPSHLRDRTNRAPPSNKVRLSAVGSVNGFTGIDRAASKLNGDDGEGLRFVDDGRPLAAQGFMLEGDDHEDGGWRV